MNDNIISYSEDLKKEFQHQTHQNDRKIAELKSDFANFESKANSEFEPLMEILNDANGEKADIRDKIDNLIGIKISILSSTPALKS